MNQEIIIGVSVVSAVVAVVGVHGWLHKLVKFKMDESSILNFFKSLEGDDTYLSVAEISTNTEIALKRVEFVCNKSKLITKDSNNNDTWCLR